MNQPCWFVKEGGDFRAKNSGFQRELAYPSLRFTIHTLKLPIRIFSDLHLAHPSCRMEVVEAMRPLIEGAKTVVFNGDTYEQRNPSLREEGEAMFQDLKALCEDCGAESIFLCGNHDAEISELEWLNLVEGKVFLTHGDVLFPLISAWNPKMWKVEPEVWAIRRGVGESAIQENLDSALLATSKTRLLTSGDEAKFKSKRFKAIRAVARLLWPPRRPWEILKCWIQTPSLAADFAKRHRPKAKVFTFGHTHRPFVKIRDGQVLINTGGFLTPGKAQFVEISEGAVSVHEINESGTEIRIGRERFRQDL